MIRAMTVSDLDRIDLLEKSLFSHPWTYLDFELELTQNPYAHYWVYEENQNVIGYLGAWISEEQAQITTLGVDKSHQGHGIATQLMRHFFEVCSQLQISQLSLEVRKSNLAAQSLYLKCGFRIAATRKNYYTQPNEDAYLMVKEDQP